MGNETATHEILRERRAGQVISLRVVRNGVEYPLASAGRRWVLGKSASCDFVIEDPFVSQAHCTIERKPGGSLVVRDKSSKNGTHVDGNPVEGAELRVGSHLRIGQTVLVAVAAAGTQATSALAALRGHDPAFRATIAQALRAAQSDCNVLILGETGTGKDLVARAVHEASRRTTGKFVAVNCGGIPRELIGSELFGHEKGAFTGAHAEREGYFVEANYGTLFLDEIGELPLELQPHLLRVLETRQVRRVGGTYERSVDVRIVAATNRIAGLGTESSRMRVDLYHRLATVVLSLPPLRERMGDLPDLVASMLVELDETGARTVSEEAWHALSSYPWPGNVRELRHAVSRAVTLGDQVLGAHDFFPNLQFASTGVIVAPIHDTKRLVPYHAMMRGAMEQALAQHGTIRAAAAALGMPKSTFADKAKAWGLVPRPKLRFAAS
ncbi:MAG: sigma 54-interacting transcriptional regulator [Kofleriaceae bacterium]